MIRLMLRDGGGDDGGDRGHGTDDKPAAQGELGYAHDIAQQVLGRTRQEEEKKHPEGEPPLILEKAEGLELIQGQEDLDGPGPEPPHQQEHRQSPREGPQQTPQGALKRAEGVARHDLQGFSGDDGHHDLEDDHAHKEQGTPQTLLVHPAPEPLRLLCELDEGPAGEPARQNREHQKQDNACAHDPSLLPECQ